MYAIYGNIYRQYTPVMLAYIPYMDPMGMVKDGQMIHAPPLCGYDSPSAFGYLGATNDLRPLPRTQRGVVCSAREDLAKTVRNLVFEGGIHGESKSLDE